MMKSYVIDSKQWSDVWDTFSVNQFTALITEDSLWQKSDDIVSKNLDQNTKII